MQRALHRAAAPLRDAVPAATWTAEENLHLTVKFIGATDPAEVDRIAATLAAVADGHRGVPLLLGRAGAFPNLRRPRVIWAGIEPAPRLELLHHDVEAALDAIGIPIEGRAFRPHVTLGRVKAPLEPDGVRALARAARRFTFEAEGTASSLDLMQSSLTPHGPRYRCLARAVLRAG